MNKWTPVKRAAGRVSYHTLAATAVAYALALGVAAGAGEDASRVYKQISPCVVQVGNKELRATGILIDTQGLLVTSSSLLGSPLPLGVAITLRDGSGRMRSGVLRDVKVVGVHKSLDLALLRVKVPSGYRTVPAKQPSRLVKQDPLRAGSKIYVVHDAGDALGKVTPTITPGLLSSPSRRVGGGNYLQFDANLTAAAVGAGLFDEKGILSGLVVCLAAGMERVSFAAPAKELAKTAFVPMSKRAGDAHASTRLAMASLRISQQARLSTGEARELLYALGFLFNRLAIFETPERATLYFYAAKLYAELEREGLVADGREIAIAYLQKALKIGAKLQGENIPHLLGKLLHETGKTKEAMIQWSAALKQFPAQAPKCALGMAQAYALQSNPLKAALFAQWSLDAQGDAVPGSASAAKAVYTKARAQLDDAAYDKLRGLVAKLPTRRAGQPDAAAKPGMDPLKKPFPATYPLVGGPWGSKPGATLGKGSPRTWTLTPAMKRVAAAVPAVQAEYTEAVIAEGGVALELSRDGATLYVAVAKGDELRMLDALSLEPRGSVTVDAEPVCLSRVGDDRLAVACSKAKTVHLIDTVKQKSVGAIRFEWEPLRVDGWAPEGYFVVVTKGPKHPFAQRRLYLVDPTSGKKTLLFEGDVHYATSVGEGRHWVFRSYPTFYVSRYDAHYRELTASDKLPQHEPLKGWKAPFQYRTLFPVPARSELIGGYGMAESVVLAPDLSARPSLLPGRIIAIAPGQDLAIVYFNKYLLGYLSLRSREILEFIALSKPNHSALGLSDEPRNPDLIDFNHATKTLYEVSSTRVRAFRVGPGSSDLKAVTQQVAQAPRKAPVVLPTRAKVGQALQLECDPEHAAGDVYSLGQHPPGMTIDPKAGSIDWTPAMLSVGLYRVEVMKRPAGKAAHKLHTWDLRIEP